MVTSWLYGFLLGGAAAWWAREGDNTFVVHLSATELHSIKLLSLISLWLLSKATRTQPVVRRTTTLVLAAAFSFMHFNGRLQLGLFGATPDLLREIQLNGIRELHLLDPPLADWINSIVWGNTKSLTIQLRQDFKTAGLYHILSVSGSHVSTLVILLRYTLLLPVHGLYVAYQIPGHVWFAFKGLLPLLSIPVLLAYLQAIGCPQAAVRATFLAIAHLCFSIRAAEASAARRCRWTLALQTLVVPEEFFSCGNLMSWMGYLCIVECMQKGAAKASVFSWGFFSKILFMQLELLGWSVACFGQLSLISIPANFFLAPIFAPVFWGAIALALVPKAPWFTPLAMIQNWFLKGVSLCASSAEFWPWLYLSKDQIHFGARLAAALVCSLLMLWRIQKLNHPQDP